MGASDGPRRIYLMTDLYSDSLWTDAPHHMIDLDGLPLSPKTKADLRAWSGMELANFDAWMEGADPPVSDEAYDAEGLRLWRVVRDELGSDYTVGYAFFDPDPEDEHGAVKRIEWELPPE